MGTPEFAVPILKSLYKSKHILQAVFTKPPKKKNRGQKVLASPIFQFAERNNITIRCPEEFDNTKQVMEAVMSGKQNQNKYYKDLQKIVAKNESILKSTKDEPNK